MSINKATILYWNGDIFMFRKEFYYKFQLLFSNFSFTNQNFGSRDP